MESRIENRSIKLRKPLTDSAGKALLSDLNALEGVRMAQVAAQTIEIEYDFPLLCFSEIWSLLNSRLETNHLGRMQKWRLSLLAYMQENEKDHMLKPAHWHLFVRDIHVHHSALRQAASANRKKQLWRKHQKTSVSQ